MDPTDLEKCQEIISYRFNRLELLQQALTHASAAATRPESNERMEFLGDAVMGLVICQEIFDRAPHLAEGEMTKIKSSVVSRATCSQIANQTGLTELMVLGKGVSNSAALPTSLGAAVLEAVIGAIFIDGGLEPARAYILRCMDEALREATASEHQSNFKSLLQQHAQRKWNSTPQYEVLDEKGPEHSKCFEIAVRMNGRYFTSAWGISKKQAEQKAALAALRELGVPVDELAEEDIQP